MRLFGHKHDRKGKGAPASSSVPASANEPIAPNDEQSKTKAKNKRGAKRKQKRKRKKGGVSISTIIMVLILIVGAGIMAYPTFSDWWNSFHQSRAIASYVTAVEETDQETIDAMMAEAHAYNERLLSKPDRYRMSDAERAEYSSILDLTGTGVIGYIQIPDIGVNLPIYHGVEESVLQVAIGHIEGSSLPVGGPSTHAAVSGHRGLPSAKLFTDLDKLVEGDIFTITVLDQTATYEVDQIRIVLPGDMSDLNIQQNEDYVTLITCTPYGINTHRILVRGHRIENLENRAVIPADAVQIPNYIAVPAVAVPMLFAYLVGSLIYYRTRRGGYDAEAVLEQIKQDAAGAGDSPEPEGAAAVEAEPEVEPEPEAETATEPEPELVVESESEAEPEPEPETEAEPAAEAEPEPEAEAEPDAEPEPAAEPKQATEPEPAAEEPESEPVTTDDDQETEDTTNEQNPTT